MLGALLKPLFRQFLFGILGSSAARSCTPQRHQRDVVLLLPAFSNEGVELLHQEVP
jgi:hypothetical protein